MDNRQELRLKLEDLQKQTKELRKELDKLDYDSKREKYSKLIGKCYKEKYTDDNIRCFFVFGLTEYCRPEVLMISYYKDEAQYFTIEYCNHIDPLEKESAYEWESISKSEFDTHYENVLSLINKKIKQQNESYIKQIKMFNWMASMDL